MVSLKDLLAEYTILFTFFKFFFLDDVLNYDLKSFKYFMISFRAWIRVREFRGHLKPYRINRSFSFLIQLGSFQSNSPISWSKTTN